MKARAPSLFPAAALPKLGIADGGKVRKHNELVELTVILKRTGALAALVDHGAGAAVWLPLSQIEISPNGDGRTHVVTLPQWLAEEKGMA